MEARTPPHSLEAEKSVLGSMLISRDAAELSAEMLTVQDFYMPQHQYIFEAMCDLVNHAKAVDSVTIVDALERAGKLAAAGGIGYIAELSLFVPSAANVSYYIKIVEDRSVLRQLIAAGGEIIKTASDSDAPITDILDEAERRVFNISMKKNEDTMVPVDKSALEAYMRIGELMKTKGEISGVPTGFKELDELTSGLQKGDLIIVAARPSVGKSTFAMNIAEYAATAANKKVAVFSLEMSKEQVVMRIMASESGVNMQKLRTGELGATEILKIADRFNTVGEAKILIDDTPGVTVAEVRSKCRRIQAIHGLDVVIIDYLQLMQSAKSQDSRVLEISAMTRALKILARELNIAVVVLSQLSREPDKRKDHTPLMSDLRESGSIEQDADVIMMLYRPAAYPDTQEAMDGDNTSYINVAKHRNGATASIKVMWVPELTKYANYAPDPD